MKKSSEELEALRQLSSFQFNDQCRDFLLSKPFNWTAIYNQAKLEGLAGICFFNLQHHSLQNHIPENIFLSFKNWYYQNMINYMLCEKTLKKIMFACSVPTIVMRGMSLTKRIYNHAGIRSFSDIDILVQPADFTSFTDTLKKLGYTPYSQYGSLFQNQGIFIDVHTDVFGISRIDSRKFLVTFDHRDLWEMAETLEFADFSCRILSVEHEILLSCYHTMKHSFLKRIWLIDIAKLFLHAHKEFDWNHFIEQARCANLNIPVYYVLSYVNHWVSDIIPRQVLQHLKTFTETRIQQRLYGQVVQHRKSFPFAELFFVSQIDKLSQKLKYLYEVAFPKPTVRQQIFQPYFLPALKFLFFPMRIFQIFKLLFKFAAINI